MLFRSESILDSVSDGVIVTDRTGAILYANAAARRLWPESWDGLPLARILRGETVEELEVFVRGPAETEGQWRGVSGRPLEGGALLLIRDVTLRRIEATNRAMFDALPDLVFRFRRDGTYVDFKGADRKSVV